MLLVHDDLAGDGERTRDLLHQNEVRLNPCPMLVVHGNIDDVVGLRATFTALVWLSIGT